MNAQALTSQRVVAPAAANLAKAQASALKAASSFAPASRAVQHRQPRRQQRGVATPAAAAKGFAAPAAAPVATAATVKAGFREEQLEGCAVRIHVTVPPQMCQQAYKKIMGELRKGASIDGYRKGKAPDEALIAHVGGMERVANSVMSEMLEPLMAQAMKPYESAAVPESERIEQGAEELEACFNLEEGFTFTVRFDAVPPLTWNKSYKELTVTVESAGDAAADEAVVDGKLLNMRKGQAKLRVVADRGLQQGDLAIVDFSAARVDSGEELVGAARQSMRLDTDDANTTFLPGIVEVITGMKAGEERVAPLTFPTDETFQPATLRGVEARITIKMTELFAFDLPEVTEEWANTLLPGGGIAGLRERLRENQQAEREATLRERIADAFTSAVGRAVECDVPESLLNELGQQQYSASLNRMLSQGVMNFETVQQLATPDLAKQFVASRREELLELQRSLLGFEEIAVREGLKPSEKEIEAEFGEASAQFGQYQQEYDVERLREQVFETVQANKVMDWLIKNCKVEVVPAAAAQ